MIARYHKWGLGLHLVLLTGCGVQFAYSLHLVFPDTEARECTSEVHVFAFESNNHSCQELVSGEVRPEELITVSEVRLPASAGDSATLPHVTAGWILFFVVGETEEGAEVLRGCTPVQVTAGKNMEVIVRLQWVCRPGPQGEIPNNGMDDDCDGLTDNCEDARTCDDDNGCTVDLCLQGECHHVVADDGVQCSDDDACTLDDSCNSGECTGIPMDCTSLDQPCAEGKCDAVLLECVTQPRQDGIECDDNLFCTTGDTCLAGTCAGQPIDCDDLDPCTEDSCDEGDQQCKNTMVPRPGMEGPVGAESCSNLQDDDCDGMIDDLDPNCLGCADAADCNDDNPCTADECDVGICRNLPVPPGTPCDDCLFCTEDDACAAGVCTGQERDCSEVEDQCHTGMCSEAEARCLSLQKATGSSCDDSEYCTVSDYCRNSGVCRGTARSCEDDEPCTLDECRESSDRCDHTWQEMPGAEGPAGDATCSNGLDDDCDGQTDDQDPDCII